MATCPNCASEVAADARICPVCSIALPQSSGTAPPPPGPPGQLPPAPAAPTGQFPPAPPGGQYSPTPPGQPVDPSQPAYAVPAYAPMPPGYAPVQQDGQAIASLILGILGLTFCPLIPSVIAIFLGTSSRRRIKASGGALTGEGLAMAGLVMGIIGTLLSVLMIGFFVFFIALGASMNGFQ